MFCDDVNANLRFVSFVLSPDYGLFLLCFEFFLFENFEVCLVGCGITVVLQLDGVWLE